MSYLINVILLFLLGCGLKPIYIKDDSNIIRYELARIKLNSIDGIIGTKLKNKIDDKLFYDINIDKKYNLDISLNKKIAYLNIQKNSFISYYNTIIDVKYKLIDEYDNLIIKREFSNSNSFNSSDNLYANYTAEDYAYDNNIEQISEIIIRDISLYFGNRSINS